MNDDILIIQAYRSIIYETENGKRKGYIIEEWKLGDNKLYCIVILHIFKYAFWIHDLIPISFLRSPFMQYDKALDKYLGILHHIKPEYIIKKSSRL
jgi:predicted AlkP superfamily pyrophosphatase or phosphodiesterase